MPALQPANRPRGVGARPSARSTRRDCAPPGIGFHPLRGLLSTHQRGIQLGGGKEHRFLDVGRAQPFGEQRAVSCERRLELGRLRRCLRGVETIAPGAQFVDGQQRRAQAKEARRLEVAAIDGCYCGHDRKGAPAERATLARRIRQDDLARGRIADRLLALSRIIANA